MATLIVHELLLAADSSPAAVTEGQPEPVMVIVGVSPVPRPWLTGDVHELPHAVVAASTAGPMAEDCALGPEIVDRIKTVATITASLATMAVTSGLNLTDKGPSAGW
jgi:hypothetical protein